MRDRRPIWLVRMSSICWVVTVTGMLWHPLLASERSERDSLSYPGSLETLVRLLENQYHMGSPSTHLLLQMSETYLDMGNDLYAGKSERVNAYQKGAERAGEALIHDRENADAHFLYAANLGHVAQLQGLLAAAFSINEIFSHVKVAVSLNPSHAGALHMLGMMYDGLPWIMGGDTQKALDYLQQAVAADRSYTHARLNLAKLLLKRKAYDLARNELEGVLATRTPRAVYAWSQYHAPEARALLKGFPPTDTAESLSAQQH